MNYFRSYSIFKSKASRFPVGGSNWMNSYYRILFRDVDDEAVANVDGEMRVDLPVQLELNDVPKLDALQ